MSAGAKKAAYQRGVKAEQVAANALRLKGYKILEQRYKTRGGEIDLIARKGDMLAFVEVKAHRSEEEALYAVNTRTRRRIESAARHYLAEHEEFAGLDMRFDVMVVPPGVLQGGLNLLGAVSVLHLDNAWFDGQ
ncbi:MAG: YraN family protein [Rhodospirillales bacterium]|nr:YraN family protein [Rhodospirillales bacterium]